MAVHMVLRMPRPWKHPDPGIFWYRKWVPEDLISVLGEKELRRSLNTRDPAVAKVEHASMSAEVEAQCRNLRQGVRSISQKQAVVIAGEIYREIVAQNEDNPGNPSTWGARLLSDWAFLKPEKVKISKLTTPAQKALQRRHAGRLRRHVGRTCTVPSTAIATQSSSGSANGAISEPPRGFCARHSCAMASLSGS